MSQHELNREISRATGESVSTIAGMGFVELRPIPFEHEPLTMDWDEHDAKHIPAMVLTDSPVAREISRFNSCWLMAETPW